MPIERIEIMEEKILTEIRELFFKKLEDKPGWGKNDIKHLYLEVCIEVLSKNISK